MPLSSRSCWRPNRNEPARSIQADTPNTIDFVPVTFSSRQLSSIVLRRAKRIMASETKRRTAEGAETGSFTERALKAQTVLLRVGASRDPITEFALDGLDAVLFYRRHPPRS